MEPERAGETTGSSGTGGTGASVGWRLLSRVEERTFRGDASCDMARTMALYSADRRARGAGEGGCGFFRVMGGGVGGVWVCRGGEEGRRARWREPAGVRGSRVVYVAARAAEIVAPDGCTLNPGSTSTSPSILITAAIPPSSLYFQKATSITSRRRENTLSGCGCQSGPRMTARRCAPVR